MGKFDGGFIVGEESFIDGSAFAVNPAEYALMEAFNLSGYSQSVDFLLSIGTGLQSSKNPKNESNFR